MNYRLVIRYLGLFALAISAFMLPSVLWAAWYREWSSFAAFLLSAAAGAAIALLLLVGTRHASDVFRQREALGLVSLSWLVVAAIGAIPYVFTGTLGPVDAYFEAMSGFTTTGSTVLTDIEAAPNAMSTPEPLAKSIVVSKSLYVSNGKPSMKVPCVRIPAALQ